MWWIIYPRAVRQTVTGVRLTAPSAPPYCAATSWRAAQQDLVSAAVHDVRTLFAQNRSTAEKTRTNYVKIDGSSAECVERDEVCEALDKFDSSVAALPCQFNSAHLSAASCSPLLGGPSGFWMRQLRGCCKGSCGRSRATYTPAPSEIPPTLASRRGPWLSGLR
jgi:hypothetical protein